MLRRRPTVALTAPTAGATVSGVVTVSADATDNVGVAAVQFRVDGTPLGLDDTAAPYTITWDTATAAAGSHTLTAVAWDAAGNQGTSTAVAVTVSNPQVTLAWDANSETDLAGYKMHFGTAPGVYPNNVDVGNQTSYTVTGLQAGTLYYFAVTAYDTSAGESGYSNEVSATW